MLVSEYHSLHEIKKNRFKIETSSEVYSLFKLVTDFGFITTLDIIRNILDWFLPVTTKLQNNY